LGTPDTLWELLREEREGIRPRSIGTK